MTESKIIKKSIQRMFYMLLLISGALVIFYYKRPVSDFYGSLVMKNFNYDLNKYDKLEQMDHLHSCLNDLLLKRNMNLKEPYDVTDENQKHSTCTDAASRRGPEQKIVSFSFYGKINQKRNYFQGIEENAKLMGKIYPKWVMRVYHDIPPLSQNTSTLKGYSNRSDDSGIPTLEMIQEFYKELIDSPQVKLCVLQHIYPNLDLCYVGNISGFGNLLGSQGNMWRFLPMADPLVDVFLSRDLDSRINEREKAAVDDWLTTNLTFHIMRDHPYHLVHILAGMWGAVTFREREKLSNLTRQLMDGGKKYIRKGLDQTLLKKIIWPAAKGASKQHDSYHCRSFKSHGNMTPWPTQRSNEPYNFVGSRIGADIKPLLKTCPIQCRPIYGKDWKYC